MLHRIEIMFIDSSSKLLSRLYENSKLSQQKLLFKVHGYHRLKKKWRIIES